MNIALLQENSMQICILILIYTAVTTIIQNKILSYGLNIKSESLKRTWMAQTVLVSLIRIVLPMPYSMLIEVLTQAIIYKFILNLKIEKVIILEEINLTMSTCVNLICAEINQSNSFSQISNNISMFLISLLIAIVLYVLLYMALKTLKIKMIIPEYINSKTKKQIIGVGVISAILILTSGISLFNVIEILPQSILSLAIILIISYYIITTISINKTIQIENEKNKISELEGNNTRLKESFDDMRSFRHDMKNIMQGLGGYIAANDMDGLTHMYNEFICDCRCMDNTKDFEHILKCNPAIYNIINNKYLEAKKDNININVEVYVDLNSIKIKTYELCRVLGILIDNAIEATRECENKQINIKFIKDNYNNRNLVIIENPCKNTLLDLSKLKEKGFTTKKDKLFHGLGLWRVNQIVKKNENLRLTTSREDNKIFKQQLEIYNW